MTQRLRLVMLACDWNGTLVDDEERARTATNHVLDAYDLQSLTPTSFRELFALPLDAFFRKRGVPTKHLRTAVRTWNDQLGAIPAPLRTGVRELLNVTAEKQIPVGVISAARTDVIRRDAAALGVLHDLAFIHGNTARKFKLLAELVERASGPVGYLGDTEHDMAAALESGALALAIRGGYKPISVLKSAGAKIIVRDLHTFAAGLAGPPRDGDLGPDFDNKR